MGQQGNFYKIYPFISETYFIDIDTTYDGGYIACGQTYGPNGGDFVVLKTDSFGNELWRYENNEFDGDSTYLFSNDAITVKEMPDHTIIVAGTLQIDNDTNNNKDLLLVKLDSTGHLIWNKKYNFSKVEAPSLLLIHKSNFYVFAHIFPNSQVILIKFNSNGDTLLKRTIQLPLNFIFNPLKVFLIDNNLFACGIADSSTTLFGNSIAKMDTSGNTLDFRYKLDTFSIYTCPDIAIGSNNSFKFLNCYNPAPGIYNIKINVCDSNYSFSYNSTAISHGLRWAILLDDSTYATRVQSYTLDPDSFFLGSENFLSGNIFRYGGFAINDLNPAKIITDKNKSLVIVGTYNNGNGYVVGFIMKTDNPNLVGIESIPWDSNQIKIFPNPTTGDMLSVILNDKLFSELKSDFSFCLYDSQGKVILSIDDIRTKSFELSSAKFLKGFYYFSIVSKNGKIISGKIIID
jgi:hypothetical protein